MLIEIGSDFHSMKAMHDCKLNIFEYLDGYNQKFFDSGRSALKMLLTFIPAKRVLLPGYICESVRDCFVKSEVSYYRIDKELRICWSDLLEKVKNNIDIVYLHFFNGYLDETYDFDELKKLKQTYGFMIVEDTTHSILTNKNVVGDYCICSLRKWFPIPDGGVLYSRQGLTDGECLQKNKWHIDKQKAMKLKNEYLEGEDIDKNKFLSMFIKSENALDDQSGICMISEISKEVLVGIDLENVITARRDNVEYLANSLIRTGIKRVALNGGNQVPLFYTVLVEERNVIRTWLIKNRIYCPVHWQLYDELETMPDAVYISAHELSIPIDQRYSHADMAYIVDVLQQER
jgi:hypothetical protein